MTCKVNKHFYRVLALIPARGGSKGIPKKNIVDLCGKPLIAWTIEAAKAADVFDAIVVSTDSEEIAKVAKDWGAETPFLRPAEFAADTSSGEGVSRHAVAELHKQGRDFDVIVYLQPTSPLRKPQHISEALDMFLNRNLPSLVSVSPVTEHPLYMRSIAPNGHMTKVLNIPSNVRRQDLQPFYILNGAIYINWVRDIENSVGSENLFAYIMSIEDSIDINTYEDLNIAKTCLLNKAHYI
ncbi:MAG: acylneuraminate cytidylyltransferase family protein [Bacteroidales bacterium]|nr:acylneuraminate cytidylyltransferase family protein [Bacteroidales bacterium]